MATHSSVLENPGDGGAWWASIYGVAQSQTWLKQLSSSSSSKTELLSKKNMQKTPQVIAVIPLSLEVDELIFNLEGFPSSLPLYSMQADKHGKVEIPGLVPKPVKKIEEIVLIMSAPFWFTVIPGETAILGQERVRWEKATGYFRSLCGGRPQRHKWSQGAEPTILWPWSLRILKQEWAWCIQRTDHQCGQSEKS